MTPAHDATSAENDADRDAADRPDWLAGYDDPVLVSASAKTQSRIHRPDPGSDAPSPACHTVSDRWHVRESDTYPDSGAWARRRCSWADCFGDQTRSTPADGQCPGCGLFVSRFETTCSRCGGAID